ncbi:MAG: DNA gyrase inhibitor YacG [Phycisphaerales bacterium]|nr:MAG: DNA gyrase inhibitor YacG [Phycisphaerales bacterium]
MPTYICPICTRALSVERRDDAPFRPFCSERCKLVDLGRWLDGTYRISEPIKRGDLDELEELDGQRRPPD